MKPKEEGKTVREKEKEEQKKVEERKDLKEKESIGCWSWLRW